MNAEHNSINQFSSETIIEELYRLGVTNFVITPGSRSAPLTLAAANNDSINKSIHFDERGAAFFAIGLAKANGKPSVLICTSGSAVANYLPAIVEAHQDNVPLILLTADRPPELQGRGANQTINQKNIFGSFVKKEIQLPCPDENIDMVEILETIDESFYLANSDSKGVVHINCPFREPLTPPINTTENLDKIKSDIEHWKNSNKPYSENSLEEIYSSQSEIEKAIEIISNSKKGLLILGRNNSYENNESILKLVTELNWITISDISSQFNHKQISENQIVHIDNSDLFCLSDKYAEKLFSTVDTVLHLGSSLVSKRLYQQLEKFVFKNYLTVNSCLNQTDPIEKTTLKIVLPISIFCERYLEKRGTTSNSRTLDEIKNINSTINSVLIDQIDSSSNLSEPQVVRLISQNIISNWSLFLANSMPIRDMNSFGSFKNNNIAISSNRGASGIDGNIATATGFASGSSKNMTIIVGDLAFLHDLNSLATINKINQAVIVVVINNDGGGIFSFLPISQQSEHFEKYFGTPHSLKFESAAKMFDLPFFAPKTAEEFLIQYDELQSSNQSAIIEIETNREENHKLHQKIFTEIKSKLDSI